VHVFSVLRHMVVRHGHGGYGSPGESRDNDQMDVYSDFKEWKTSEEIRNRPGVVSMHRGVEMVWRCRA
jgi:hypothetical protein